MMTKEERNKKIAEYKEELERVNKNKSEAEYKRDTAETDYDYTKWDMEVDRYSRDISNIIYKMRKVG